jgi:hypothetical protein
MTCASLLLLTAACGNGDDNSDESKGSPAVTSAPETSMSPEPMESMSPSASAGPTEAAAAGTTVTIALVKGKPEKLLDDVKLAKGDLVTIKVTSDAEHEIHIHGYDKKIEVKPGVVERVTFKADQTGSFLVEVEDTGAELFHLQVK